MPENITTTPEPPSIDFRAEISEPRLLSFLFAEWAETTNTGKAVIAGVFDRLYFRPDTNSEFYIYLRLAQVGNASVKIVIFAPDGSKFGELILERQGNLAITDANPEYMHGATRLALPIKLAGVYWFDVIYEGKRLGIAPLQTSHSPENSDGKIDV